MNLKKLKSIFRFRRRKTHLQGQKESISDRELSELWKQCPSCKTMLYVSELKRNLFVCKKCNYHFRMGARDRIELLVDENSWQELFLSVRSADPLNFSDLKPYSQRLLQANENSDCSEAVITGTAKIHQIELALAVMEFAFLGGSMGSVVGERLTRLCQHAIQCKSPLIIVTSSGGARMHEGLFSLLQMAKTSAALAELREHKLLFISILADPTYGGVSASFAMLGDIIIAEPNAKIGFAGPRVIEETIRQKLPKGFQSAEYLLEHGQVDSVIERRELRETLALLLRIHQKK